VTRHLVPEQMLEAAQVGGQALGEPVAEFARDRGVVGTRPPSRQEPGQPGAPILSRSASLAIMSTWLRSKCSRNAASWNPYRLGPR
jgi:hypothetical protein